jgi:hypothetical protein
VLRGLRLRDLEQTLHIADTVLSQLERGELPLVGHRLRQLAKFYQTPPAKMVDEMRAWAARTSDDRFSARGELAGGEFPESAA